MILFPLLIAAHLIGDWVVQTDWMARYKWTNLRQAPLAMLAHLASYHVLVVVAALIAGLSGWPLAILFGVSWFTHLIIDRRTPVLWLMEHTGSKPFSQTSWGPMVVDQALHISILSALAGVFG